MSRTDSRIRYARHRPRRLAACLCFAGAPYLRRPRLASPPAITGGTPVGALIAAGAKLRSTCAETPAAVSVQTRSHRPQVADRDGSERLGLVFLVANDAAVRLELRRQVQASPSTPHSHVDAATGAQTPEATQQGNVDVKVAAANATTIVCRKRSIADVLADRGAHRAGPIVGFGATGRRG